MIPVFQAVASPPEMLPGSRLLPDDIGVYLATTRGETRVFLVNGDEALSAETLAGVSYRGATSMSKASLFLVTRQGLIAVGLPSHHVARGSRPRKGTLLL